MKDMKGTKIFIGGIQGSGKTVAAKFFVRHKFRSAIGLRMTKDFDDVDNIMLIPPSPNPQADMEEIAGMLIEDGKKVESGEKAYPDFDVLVIDEADLFFPNNYSIGGAMQDLVAMHRHYKIAIIFITRRTQDISQKIVDTCKHKLFYLIEGTNAQKYISNVDPEILVLMKQVSFDKHNFVYKEIGRRAILHKPLPMT